MMGGYWAQGSHPIIHRTNNRLVKNMIWVFNPIKSSTVFSLAELSTIHLMVLLYISRTFLLKRNTTACFT